MRFLADENFPGAAITALTAARHDVVSIRIAEPGARDRDVLARAAREERILLTFDKDFGELAANTALPAGCGIVLFRRRVPKSAAPARRLAEIISSRDDWAGHFSVIEPGRTRMRALK
jgi:hypothetical protein